MNSTNSHDRFDTASDRSTASVSMTSSREDLAIKTVIAELVGEIHFRVLEATGRASRCEVIATLRADAKHLQNSPLVVQQFRAQALSAAALDVDFSRPLLEAWLNAIRHEMAAPPEILHSDESVRRRPSPQSRLVKTALARFERECLARSATVFDGIRQLPTRFEAALALQKKFWSDPRMTTDNHMRIAMREALDALEQRWRRYARVQRIDSADENHDQRDAEALLDSEQNLSVPRGRAYLSR